jgi:hypothetical protein
MIPRKKPQVSALKKAWVAMMEDCSTAHRSSALTPNPESTGRKRKYVVARDARQMAASKGTTTAATHSIGFSLFIHSPSQRTSD